MKALFAQFDVEYISGVMSLRKPQKISLKRLADIVEEVPPCKLPDLEKSKDVIHNLFPTFTDFERDFMSLTFALATGVGKTRLMGAFITYLYCQYGYRNYFVVAPNLTIYNKLKSDFGDCSSKKYVFRGCGCYSKPPRVYADDEYCQKPLDFAESDINIFVFNIDKFNSEDATMRALNEYIGESFFEKLSELNDLVLLMDESHHYRAKQSAKSLNELKPILGLELTATPLVNSGNRQIPFKNVVYEYPLSSAIKDGYTRTPYALGRPDLSSLHFGDDQLDQIMLTDGIKCHERIKLQLEAYAQNYGKPVVKPFMLVVCKDTGHAQKILELIRSDEFFHGKYRNKTITIHSAQRGVEREENVKLLLDVEKPDNPVEIVIHVNVLKEGWDVNNLYTIVPLRTAASRILREQTVGRGLRLPYGEQTGEKNIDAVYLTAHDKFDDVVREAERGESIFNKGNIIKIKNDEPELKSMKTQPELPLSTNEMLGKAYSQTGLEKNDKNDETLSHANDAAAKKVMENLGKNPRKKLTEEDFAKIAAEVVENLSSEHQFGEDFGDMMNPFCGWVKEDVKQIHDNIVSKYIPIPKIKVTDYGTEEYIFSDFDLDLSEFHHAPIDNRLLIQNLLNRSERQFIDGEYIHFEQINPAKVLVSHLREKPEIDYEACSELLFRLITSVLQHYIKKYGEDGTKNIVMMYQHDISNKIYNQMMQHFSCGNSLICEEVTSVDEQNLPNSYTYAVQQNLWDTYSSEDESLKKTLFCDIRKGVFPEAKFDSVPELIFARVLEQDSYVKKWLRPAPQQFNLTYNRSQHYIPDFVVETETVIYLVEVKGEDRLKDANVIAKKMRGVQYCRVASDWGLANGYKKWSYLFIPSKQVTPSSTFENLCQRFVEENG